MIKVTTAADRLLLEGLPHLQPILDELGDRALLIGGLATAAWLTAHPVDLPVRATRDVDLGIDRVALGITRSQARIQPLMRQHQFAPGYGNEDFRFARGMDHGTFVVDVLVAPGSRADPPPLEPGLTTLAAPGLAYAQLRGPIPLELVLAEEDISTFRFWTVHLDAAFVMKAALVASGARTRRDRATTDTVDAVMLAAACLDHGSAIDELGNHPRRSDVKTAVGWLAKSFKTSRSAAAQRVAAHAGATEGADWSVEVAARFVSALED